jgi:hypothetical protein
LTQSANFRGARHAPRLSSQAGSRHALAAYPGGAPLAIASGLYELDDHVLLAELRRRAEAAATDHQLTRS